MAAEAYSRLGDDATALGYLNQVRQRAGMFLRTSSGNELYEHILKERRSELSCEGHRFFDLVRTGKRLTELKILKQVNMNYFQFPK